MKDNHNYLMGRLFVFISTAIILIGGTMLFFAIQNVTGTFPKSILIITVMGSMPCIVLAATAAAFCHQAINEEKIYQAHFYHKIAVVEIIIYVAAILGAAIVLSRLY
jgi:hypothetical protein